MALTASEQELLDFALAALPHWFTSAERQQEFLAAAAKVMGAARAQAEDWLGNALILGAVGPTGSDPDWLNQHARDRATSRQAAETDDALRERLRNVPDALTRITLLAAAQAIVDAEAVVGAVAMVELPRDGAYLATLADDNGNAGTWTDRSSEGADLVGFLPSAGFAGVPYREIPEDVTHKLEITGSDYGANDGTWTIVGLYGNEALVAIPGASFGADAGASWSVQHFDALDNALDGYADSYLGRGDRLSGPRPGIVLILPYGCTENTRRSVLEMLRQKKAAGFFALVECRLIP